MRQLRPGFSGARQGNAAGKKWNRAIARRSGGLSIRRIANVASGPGSEIFQSVTVPRRRRNSNGAQISILKMHLGNGRFHE
jgi:hypothetical protein